MPRSLPRQWRSAYALPVTADSRDIRRLRVPDELWDAYSEIVGNAGRSADLKAYMEWRVDHPSTPLPGRRRGPVRKVKPSRDATTG